jgi:tRNA pseudouridine(55) synthase
MKVPPYVVLEKKRGSTPLQAIAGWKAEHAEFVDVPASYAGRLDPMASGKLLVLLGDECKKQEKYIRLDKEYEIEIVLNLQTDTGDTLGLATYVAGEQGSLPVALAKELGSHSRKYPVYSSKTVNGKPLFLYTLEGKLDDITIPAHIETIYKIQKITTKIVSKQQLQTMIDDSLAVVPRSDEPSKVLGADFRQDAIRERWQKLFEIIPDREFTIMTLRVTCASGAYMRTLAERIGKSLGSSGLTLSIDRTKIGKFTVVKPFGFWQKLYT